ncbi:MAG TPA: hypothetical protein VK508_20320 [Cyclobacteriaceae bacterium]|nr:hypothetical protein [Cyclobacteriaceae bacterium]
MRTILFIVFLFCLVQSSAAQQMVVIKKGKILTRFYLGDEIRFVMKDDPKQLRHVAILSIREFEFVTLQKDTIQFSQISKLKFRNKGLKKYVVSTLIGSASLLALHFALKGPFGESNPMAVNGLAYAAGSGVLPLLFAVATSRSSMRLNGFKRLKFINYDSPLYK